jgi:hypothetical protein
MLDTFSERAFEHDGSETWTLRRRVMERRELRVFENMTPRKMFGPKRLEITLNCKECVSEELHNLQVLFTYLSLYIPCGPWPFFQFHDLYTDGRIPWTGDQPVARPLPTHRTT